MPQASPELREKWGASEDKAEAFLFKNFTIERGLIRPKLPHYEITDEEYSAINYLIDEWDHEFGR
jgi:hypothetical protein